MMPLEMVLDELVPLVPEKILDTLTSFYRTLEQIFK